MLILLCCIHVAPALLSRICLYDGVSIFRGTRVTPHPVITFCGSEVPEPISVFGPMLLNFYTDSHVVGFGFQARYRTIGKCLTFGNTLSGYRLFM